ncbi:ABC1 family protein [Leptolyngbya boryana NIES-2135]|jgi:ubiquinone biosynthesis protein|uniref:ABC1 family protein n=1 Tax=Leptolyngbya boryana NIES-2135 TaxID=1973484 RepID=A0A1Z4JFM0_LEPBY|nr:MULTISPECIES: AarF/ABC1/UbiB kinase family protein [Leptolyngbya]BAY55575.1 ABC1 family protein [Leptolyngbya boryana NIES-2135]MBD2369937.1 AarF/ABC1/UbiB kinase family protein [Leptolyngbya sp. FACHB-161]MBD2376361.1 AarF/ABC1/UbiB kinase family protein [Leptolyngbya sp. FACHB-238]MBD2400636.1 AarF/ABC1/UbiB kinase family protein [Leptolyngbya sp. FACHB-239]MBD2407178.1 AarF/ABC1/UbiB kinase family protein [Leptolyngbya sp. FACHB-402]
MFSRLVQTSSRQGEILEVVLRNGWDFMRRLLTGGKVDEPKLPPPAVLRNILVDLGPVYVKLGQLLSTRPDLLPAEYIDALSTLQAEVPPVDWAEIEVVLRKQFSQPLEEVFASVNYTPVAAGSIAQTHYAVLKDGRAVALKVQRPGLSAVVEQDIALIRLMARLVAQTDFGQYYDIVAIAEEFAEALRNELDFTQEARYTDQLRQNLSGTRWFDASQLVVPQIYWEYTTDKLVAMEWLDGVAVLSAFPPISAAEGVVDLQRREEISTLLLRAFFQQICLDGFFHADPHPGNVFYLKDGRVALLDCGMVGRLDPRTQQLILELVLAIVNLDAQRCTQLVLQLAPPIQPINRVKLETEFDRLLRRYYSLNISQVNFSKLVYEVLQIVRDNKVRVPGNLGLCAKAIANLEGIARSLDPNFNIPNKIRPMMTEVFQRQIVGEAPLIALLRTVLDVKNLSLQSPRQVELLLDRVTSETLQWNFSIREAEPIRRTVDSAANRVSFSIVVGSLIMGAAIISANTQSSQVYWVSDVLFAAASFLGLWLIISILRSGPLR